MGLGKSCTVCGLYKLFEEFDRNGTKKRKDGKYILKSYCRDCRVIKNKEMYLRRKEKGYYKKKEPEEDNKE